MLRKIALTLLCLVAFNSHAADEFPGRNIYPSIPVIEIDQLYKEKDKAIIIDARSPYEYQTLRIKGAKLISLASSTQFFAKELKQIREENPASKIVFYCNGHKCMKSYKAVKRATNYVGVENVYAFDAGVFDWAKKYPEETLLLDKVLGNPEKLISSSDFKKHVLPAEKFIKSANRNVAILDIRDRIERDGFYIFSGEETSISMNDKDREKLELFMDKIKRENKTLYVYDMVGKQVVWFQYYIESKGINNYYFMEGGADAFYKLPISRLMDSQ